MPVIFNLRQGGDYVETENKGGGCTLHTHLEGKLEDKHLKCCSGLG